MPYVQRGSVVPDVKAFLLIDMQRCALPHAPFGVPNMPALVENANRAISACRTAGVPLIFTRHRQLRTFVGLGGSSAADAFRDQGGYELVNELDYRPGIDQVLDKQHWTAFRHTDLEDRLSVLPGRDLVICGTVTDGCVLLTAYDAFYRQYRVVFIEDAIGSCTLDIHRAAMLGMANWLYESRITTAEKFARWLGGLPYEGWVWQWANEFPYTVESLRADYDSLLGKRQIKLSSTAPSVMRGSK